VDGLTLLREARRAGLRITAKDDLLVVAGPRRLELMAMTILAEKPSILEALAQEDEVAWRIDAMRRQVTVAGAVPLLIARPAMGFASGMCCSCGDALGNDDRYRCQLCVAAAVAVLGAVP